ncbi:hypothetical protein [Streptacidiphilus melanogenes]|uniref:hypothetical protein n=1 Tax=Streptacidiphilus melanogenes TaxID=411235 RepID=UPI00126A0521|nr:hypothetical protein [Streptacidiphilus melanogenes]
MRLFSGPWGDLRVFTDEPLPSSAIGIAEVPARFGANFRPALLRHFLHLRLGRPADPYVAVWPDEVVLPDLTEEVAEPADDLRGVVLAELMRHKCFVCNARFEVVRPEVGIPVLGRNLAQHRIVSGCPSCGSDSGTSRIHGLALSPLP